ncbi:MAG: hypothetical protein ACKV2T_04480 [Kofleriaceae bacterium]
MESITPFINAAVIIGAIIIAQRWLGELRAEVASTQERVRDLQSSVTELLGAVGDLLQQGSKVLEGTATVAQLTVDCSEILQELSTRRLTGD